MKFKDIKLQSDDKSLRLYDWIVFGVLAVLCFFLMSQGDVLHAAGSSVSLLNGHILDFYDYTSQYMSGNNYLISTFAIFAIWNIPIRLFDILTVPTWDVPYGVLLWDKALTSLFFLASIFLIYLIAKEIGFDNNKSKISAYAFATMPFAFFSQFIFGQYDVFTVFFMLLGIYFYFKDEKKSMLLFSLYFGIACTFKYFALLIYLPMLLLKKKKISELLINCGCFAGPLALVILPYIGSSAFKQEVFGFGATSYVFDIALSGTRLQLSVVPIAFIVLCVCALFKQELQSKGELFSWVIFYGCVVFFLCFGLSHWHPQWLMLGAPFWALGLMMSKRVDISCLIDIALMLLFSVYVVNTWANHVDQRLFQYSVLKPLVAGKFDTAGVMMRDLYVISDIPLVRSCFAGVLAASTLIKHPKFCTGNIGESVKKSMNWLRARFIAGISVFLIPMFICLPFIINAPMRLSSPEITGSVGIIPPITDGQRIEQVFTCETDNISQIGLQVGTYQRTNDFILKAEIADEETGSIVTVIDIATSELADNDYSIVEFPSVSVESGKRYRVSFISEGANELNTISFYRTGDNTALDNCYAVIDGVVQSYTLAVNIYGK